ncbi:hypothetical protein BKA14_007189 [Actinoplanes abujensis]|uniref:Uncharacterized protein n=1 Tax=Paractinoplanes abujensis TaxID=882441 RepID=A0A7W7D1H8_9ACTN|nr:hypothetical protein [Actinoplanes abujensis]
MAYAVARRATKEALTTGTYALSSGRLNALMKSYSE